MKGILIKYGEEDHLKAIVNGSLRFSPSQIYVNMEKDLHNKGQGDLLDGKWVINNVTGGKFVEEGTGRIGLIPPNSRFYISIQDVNSMPVFCLSHYGEECITEEIGEKKFSLPEGRLDQIKHDFPKATHALMIFNPGVFIQEAEKAEGHRIVSDRIHYFDYSVNEMRMASFLTTGDENTIPESGISYTTTYNDRYRHLLCKDNDFKNQDEYRFIILDELIDAPKSYKFNFLSEYRIVPLDALKDKVVLTNAEEKNTDIPELTEAQINYIKSQQDKADKAVSDPNSEYYEEEPEKRKTAARALMRKWEREKCR